MWDENRCLLFSFLGVFVTAVDAFRVCLSLFFPPRLRWLATSLRALLLFSQPLRLLQLLEFVFLRALSRLLLAAAWFGSYDRLPFPESAAGYYFRLLPHC
ncbi:hypothetical protein PIB30_065636 [Stylosanthes scabra]|uniref:Uncharacterized protein n=1 Tax=Stylosanthes scabra TaxID=79078 RepID=A0ABU6ZKT9_9FABA|nr:hypothetical protein [Stylosanthes scabra]